MFIVEFIFTIYLLLQLFLKMLYQVNRLFFHHNLAKQFCRNLHQHSSEKKLYPLKSRTLLKVSGNDTPIFLQGLITNDMQHFEEGVNSIYAMFLNNKGRVLYDTLIHKWKGNNSFLLECDVSVHKLLQNHLKVYKLRRNVEIVDMSEHLRLFVLIPSKKKDIDTQENINKDVHIYKDPRLAELGHRVIASNGEDSCISSFGDSAIVTNDETGYKYIRYKLGVSEGAEELPPGTCFPLEANCDYLHGVSFHKGCYIGQELTARVHHTGVVRKRIMPFRFTGTVEEEINKDSVITADDAKKSSVGKIKTFIKDYGLGLIRIKEALEATSLKLNGHSIEVIKPHWWPIEAPKEKVTVKVE